VVVPGRYRWRTFPVTFVPEHLKAVLGEFPYPRRYWIAYSGGLDSTALVHALVRIAPDLPGTALRAVHVDHGLQAESGQWALRCVETCATLGIPCRIIRVRAEASRGQSPEAAARDARYRALGEVLGEDEALCTAHHQDDQAETLLLQLLRGAGPLGLAGMPRRRRFGRGWLLRPLLDVPRAEIRSFAEALGLSWEEDPTNFLPHHDRNYLRHEVLPSLRARWPSFSRTFARSAEHCGECAMLARSLAEQDLAAARGTGAATLSAERLTALNPARQRNVLRAWFGRLGLPAPPAARLESIRKDLVVAARDRTPVVTWSGGEVRRHRGDLYAMRPLPAHDPTQALFWEMDRPLRLAQGTLSVRPARGAGLSAQQCRRLPVTVRFRRGGERCRPVGRPRSRDLKRLLQEQGVPPWERECLPLVYLGEDIAAVGHLCICEPYGAKAEEDGLVICWRPLGEAAPPLG
jgi:tRNA(Ile)-lysidine synthase